MGNIIGLSGVIIATAISRLLTTFWYEGKVLYKKFKVSVKEYYIQQLKAFIVLIITDVIAYNICALINKLLENHFILFGLNVMIATIVSIIIIFITYSKSEEYIYLIKKLKQFRRNKMGIKENKNE